MWTKKTNSEKANFCSNIVFSLYFKLRAKNNSLRKTTRFSTPLPVSAWPKSLLQLDFKYQGNVWTNLQQKRQLPITIQILWIVKTRAHKNSRLRGWWRLIININLLMSEELLLNDRRVEKIFNPPGIEPLTSRSITRCTDHSGYQDLSVDMLKQFYISHKLYCGVGAKEVTQNEEWKRRKSHLRSQRMI